jgi:hypothetical protein
MEVNGRYTLIGDYRGVARWKQINGNTSLYHYWTAGGTYINLHTLGFTDSLHTKIGPTYWYLSLFDDTVDSATASYYAIRSTAATPPSTNWTIVPPYGQAPPPNISLCSMNDSRGLLPFPTAMCVTPYSFNT